MEPNPTFDRVIEIVERARAELIDLCLQLGNISSPHGQERDVGEAVLVWLKQYQIPGKLQFITQRSVNAVATMPGSGQGPSLIFNAHMDTGPELPADASEDAKKLETAWVKGEMLFGKGMINDKAQLCAFIMSSGHRFSRRGIRH